MVALTSFARSPRNKNNEKYSQIKAAGVVSRDAMLGFFPYKNKGFGWLVVLVLTAL